MNFCFLTNLRLTVRSVINLEMPIIQARILVL